jgi:hypothetical protein
MRASNATSCTIFSVSGEDSSSASGARDVASASTTITSPAQPSWMMHAVAR